LIGGPGAAVGNVGTKVNAKGTAGTGGTAVEAVETPESRPFQAETHAKCGTLGLTLEQSHEVVGLGTVAVGAVTPGTGTGIGESLIQRL